MTRPTLSKGKFNGFIPPKGRRSATKGGVTVTERKRVAPQAEDIELVSQGMFYLPIWCVEGVHGVLIINAGTGKIVSEDYYKL